MSGNQADFPIATMARVLGVSEAGYHAWRKRPPSRKKEADTTLLKRVRTIYASSRETYGAPRVHAELRAGGERHGRKRIARLMRAAGLVGASRRWAGITTTRRDREARPAPDLVDRKFAADRPNRLWVADITFVPTASGFLYLAVVPDAWSRKIVGWAMANHIRAELVVDALEMAIGQRRPGDVIHHSDQGSQYTSPWRSAIAAAKRACGRPWAQSATRMTTPCESFFAMLECELLERRRFASQAEAKMACFSFTEGITPSGCTRRWATAHPWPTKPPTGPPSQKLRKPSPLDTPRKRGSFRSATCATRARNAVVAAVSPVHVERRYGLGGIVRQRGGSRHLQLPFDDQTSHYYLFRLS